MDATQAKRIVPIESIALIASSSKGHVLYAKERPMPLVRRMRGTVSKLPDLYRTYL